MFRSCFLGVKHFVYAVAVLAILACLTEIGLRIYDSATGQITRRDAYDRGIVCKNWFVHHTLKPSRTFTSKDPDAGERIRITVNSLGLRGAEPEIPKPNGLLRIICLGDDATFALSVSDAETFCRRLQEELATELDRQVEVINAGVPDYCPLLSYLQYRHQLLALDPDLVILNFDPTDVADDYHVRRYAAVNRDGVALSCTHPDFESTLRSKGKREPMLLFPQFARQKINRLVADQTLGERSRSIESNKCRYLWLDDAPAEWQVYIDQAVSPLRSLDELARSRGAKFLVAACPAPWQISSSASSGDGVRERNGVARNACFTSRRPFDVVAQACRTDQIPFLDSTDAFLEAPQPDRLFQINSAMLSFEGHAVYAKELAAFVLESAFGANDKIYPANDAPPLSQAGFSAPFRDDSNRSKRQ